jgi:hypothetical protein
MNNTTFTPRFLVVRKNDGEAPIEYLTEKVFVGTHEGRWSKHEYEGIAVNKPLARILAGIVNGTLLPLPTQTHHSTSKIPRPPKPTAEPVPVRNFGARRRTPDQNKSHIRLAREKLNMSRPAVRRLTKIAEWRLRTIEKTRSATLQEYTALATVLNVPLAWIQEKPGAKFDLKALKRRQRTPITTNSDKTTNATSDNQKESTT